jgi:catechol 2,3-dioxygenase-like lactoylglutathione lyase family enzyme
MWHFRLIVGIAVMMNASSAFARIDLSQREGVQEMIVSVKDLDQASAVYRDVAKFEVKSEGAVDKSLNRLWALPENTHIQERLLGLPSTSEGLLRLVKIEGLPQVQIRSSARPFDTGGIFNINSLVKDMDGVFEALRDYGFQGFADPNRYTLFGKNYAGSLLRGHDGVVINLLQRVNQPYDDLPTFTTMSHIINATQMVRDYDESYAFYTQKLGWVVRWEASPTWPPDGSNNMGIPNSVLLSGMVKERAASFKFSKEADGGTIEIFAFEGIRGKDFSDRAQPPNLGILAYRIHVRDLDSYAAQIAARGVTLARPIQRATVAPYGEVKIMVVRAPGGAWLEFFQQVAP